jgi:hypothetical protein
MQKFKVEASGIANVLISPIAIFPPFPLNIKKQDWPKPFETRAIWDTGATHTVISRNVINDLSLKPTGKVKAHGVHGKNIVNTYLIHVGLPNRFLVPTVRVLEGNMANTNVLIGMDIITKGDFIISNVNGKTTFEFGMPATGVSLSDKLSNKFGKGIKIPRNLRVKIKNHQTNQTKEGKFKDLEEVLNSENWFISEIKI